jgi:O-antigen biosynthesis protein
MTADSATPARPPITIVVPVYRGLEVTRACLESLIASDLPENASIVVINDCSPEAALSTFCSDLAAQFGFRLVLNTDNLGFVKTANKGFALDPDADIVLLNSDTVVSNDWLQRLQSCAYKEDAIGTVTPFTNNGTICSYPVFFGSNNLPINWSADELDKAFALANAGFYAELPTAVGFCMYIKRTCLNETGTFDEKNFGYGYGEECDFSMRASALGWKHVAAADVFVFHEGGASFASESSQRKRRADKTMQLLHPEYDRLINEFQQSDPLYKFRSNVDSVRLRDKPADSAPILQEHFHYTRTLLERTAELYTAVLEEREQRQQLERLLGDCRRQFAETDRALAETQHIVDKLNGDIDIANINAHKLRDHIHQLRDQITSMEQSRSWRYTAWLRRK